MIQSFPKKLPMTIRVRSQFYNHMINDSKVIETRGTPIQYHDGSTYLNT